MSRRCKAGQRARVICEGENHGKIVLVVQPYFYPAKVSDATWERVLRAWVVTSFGAPLACYRVSDAKRLLDRTIVMDDRHLEPVQDDDDAPSEHESNELPANSADLAVNARGAVVRT